MRLFVKIIPLCADDNTSWYKKQNSIIININ